MATFQEVNIPVLETEETVASQVWEESTSAGFRQEQRQNLLMQQATFTQQQVEVRYYLCEGSIYQTQEQRSNLAMLHERVAELQNEVAGLKAEKAKLEEKCFSQEIEIELTQTNTDQLEAQVRSITLDFTAQKAALEGEINEYKRSLKKATIKLEKVNKNNKYLTKRLKELKKLIIRREEIMKVNQESKVGELEETIETLKQENKKMQEELATGFIGRFRRTKRFFRRVIDALRGRAAQ